MGNGIGIGLGWECDGGNRAEGSGDRMNAKRKPTVCCNLWQKFKMMLFRGFSLLLKRMK
jgi:hypothetical protein